jgi:7-cyano-7-deazaguanine synthase
MKKAVCLISGGMDSYVSAAVAKKKNYKIYALTVNYGQKNKKELRYAKKIAGLLPAEKHFITNLDLSWAKSALTDEKIKIPSTPQKNIPDTYVPARNTIFLSISLALAESIDAEAVFIGINSVDFSGYPDCRPVYIKRFQKLVEVATKKTSQGEKIKIIAPLLHFSKAEIIKKGMDLKLDFSHTWSCYKSGKYPCGKCPSCRLRKEGFKKAGIKDPSISK